MLIDSRCPVATLCVASTLSGCDKLRSSKAGNTERIEAPDATSIADAFVIEHLRYAKKRSSNGGLAKCKRARKMIRRFINSTWLLALLAACGSEPAKNEASVVTTETASISPTPAAHTEVPVAKAEPPKELPSLYGQWIPDEESCPVKGALTSSVIEISSNGISQYENNCSAKPRIPRNGIYRGNLSCWVEADLTVTASSLSVRDDGKLKYESDGSATVWKRCPWHLEMP